MNRSFLFTISLPVVLLGALALLDDIQAKQSGLLQDKAQNGTAAGILAGDRLDLGTESLPILRPRDWSVPEPEVTAALAYAVDLKNDTVFFARGDISARWPVASISKLMTALVVRDIIPLTSEIVISETAVETEGGAGGFAAGELYTAQDLVTAMLLTSSNDAAVALSESIGKDKFAQLMNLKAELIGLDETVFVEPSGLSQINQSTLRDLAKFSKYLSAHAPELLELTSRTSVEITDIAHQRTRQINNINAFAGKPFFVGGKTGSIETSGQNLLTVASAQNSTVAVIVLNSSDRFADTERILDFINKAYAQ